MRIALVSESFYPAVDGTTTTVRAVADRLVDTGHQVLVVAPGPGLPTYRGCRVVRVLKPGRSEQVRSALADFRPDLVHLTSPAGLGRRAAKHAQAMRVPVLQVQQTPVADLGADYWRATTAARADRVVVTAHWMRRRLADLGVPASLWAPGVDHQTFTPELRDPAVRRNWARNGEVLVGYVGALRNRHDVRRLAEVTSLPGTRLVVVGEGAQEGWLKSQVPTGKFVGPLATGALALTVANLDVLVHPGVNETCCHPLREAAASGVPVVAPAAGGAPDVVKPLETGLLHDPDDPRAMLRALAAVVGDSRRDLLGRHARTLAVRRSWADAVDELVERHYLPLLATSPTAA
ncbi:glycosyltransferase family 1 protein [Nocardioides aestuarii]|uniref:Glycosyltransferase n=1 Tax=Nocardioides aestuarii TaxID=252231 RepID=A0ABW4TQQ1_9ACTN